jgi:hypothetical protein
MNCCLCGKCDCDDDCIPELMEEDENKVLDKIDEEQDAVEFELKQVWGI